MNLPDTHVNIVVLTFAPQKKNYSSWVEFLADHVIIKLHACDACKQN